MATTRSADDTAAQGEQGETAHPPKPSYRFSGDLPVALAHLRDQERWVCWTYRTRKGKVTKPPINPRTGRLASVSDPETWGRFDEALAGMQRYDLAGIALVLTEGGGVSGADLDHCISDSDGLTPLAAERPPNETADRGQIGIPKGTARRSASQFCGRSIVCAH